MNDFSRFLRPVPLAFALGLAGLGAAVIAQIEGGDRGVAPIDSSSDFEVSGIKVDVAAKTADAARYGGWREAQRQGWRLLWSNVHGGPAPGLSDSALDSIVAGIVVDNEQVGPNRYIATLGVLFDRVRAGQILGVSGSSIRSAPLLVIPVQWSGGTPQSFETRTEWQKAWARFRTGGSSIDYVRPSGTGADPLLLNYGQTGRPGRRWWRMLLDQYGAADVLIPQVRLERMWPGGPVIGHFSARFGPDNRLLSNFVLRVGSSAGIPQMMDEGVRRMDQIFSQALADGRLRPDSSLVIEQPVEADALVPEDVPGLEATDTTETADSGVATAGTATFSVQYETPDVASVGSTEAAVRGIAGVRSASTGSLALGGISVMRVTYAGDIGALKAALAAKGFRVQEGGGALRISR
ncbi:heavy-metal-associated domain-containing protein [Aquisediminimonas profunda]|uniref:heavy-metal-associated domain-containing protein n=1 Tax=Aquisediminimonas profunda TaxID=1550733 RepID=UPI001C6381D5|nr:heavy-metal-associated domain-containing protein [Aquisediminimonas profunda]